MGTPLPRGSESTLPGRVSTVRNVTTPSWSGRRPGKPTVRKAQSRGGRRMVQEANAGGRKAAGNRDVMTAPSGGRLRITGRIRADARTRKGADVDQVSL